MGRTAKALLHHNQIITIETDLSGSIRSGSDFKKIKGSNIGSELWDYLFVFYFVDEDRLVYAHEGLGLKPDKLIYTIANDLHPSAEEKFDTVQIINEDTGDLLMTLHNVELIGILEGIKEVMEQ